jgi:nucleotide-binding universal stress UspA family protein
MRFLIAIDDSRFSEAAVQMLIRQVRPEGSEVTVVHVIEPVPVSTEGYLWGFPVDLPGILEGQRKAAHEVVARAAEILRKAGWKVSSSVEEGDPQTRIIDRAAEWKTDLILLGSHGRKGFDRFLLGSVSEAVAQHAHCSVEIVRIPSS